MAGMQRWVERTAFLPDGGRQLALGLGLIGIGKPWGFVDDVVPADAQAQELLETAVELGVRYFDSAPSYGISEERFGAFLRGLRGDQRQSLTIATKFGEHWDADKKEPFVDHSYDALVRSLDGSLEKLGRIDFLQLHKTTPEALNSPDVERAFAYATSLGIANIGASVSDLVSASIAVGKAAYSVVQFPLNPSSLQFRGVAAAASEAGMLVATNRPFGMGKLLYGQEALSPDAAFSFLAAEPFQGVVLTGTKSATHLRENWAAFHAVMREADRAALHLAP